MPTSGKTKTTRRKEVWSKTNGICAHCGRMTSSKFQTIDHIIPKSIGGGYDYRNLMPLCKKCNKEKSNKIIEPLSYYSFAPNWVIDEFEDYIISWTLQRTNLNGELYTKEKIWEDM